MGRSAAKDKPQRKNGGPGPPGNKTHQNQLGGIGHAMRERAFAFWPACKLGPKPPSCRPFLGRKSMKKIVFTGLFVLASTAAFAQSGGQTDKQTYDVPSGSKDQEIIIQIRKLQDGESVTPHIHHGVEMTEVVQGTFELYVKGQPVKIIHTGESFLVPREAPHDARPVPGTGPVTLAVTLVIDKGTAPRTPVTDVLIPKK
jgi:quercetin dioxygenase-like cupin family protein